MYDEIVKEKIDQVVPDTPEDNMAKKASSWASQSVRKHLMGILCEELAALFQTVWVSDVKNAKSMGNFLIVSEQKKPRIVVTVSKSRVVVRSDARIHLVFNDSRERSESNASSYFFEKEVLLFINLVHKTKVVSDDCDQRIQ